MLKGNGLKTILASTVIGAFPNISKTPAETTIKDKAQQGLLNVSSTFPARGKLVGTGMVLKQVKKLTKKRKRKK